MKILSTYLMFPNYNTKKSNEKKDLVFEFVKAEHTDKRRIYISVKYSANGSKTKTEEILKKIKKEKAFGSISLKQIEKFLGFLNAKAKLIISLIKMLKDF
jgi:endonuclease III